MSNKKEQVKKAELSKTAKIIKKTVNFITLLVVIAVVIFAFLIVGIRAFGVDLYIILSGSMEPDYHTGGLIYVVDVDPADLKVGDDITFKLSNGTPATHRIIEIVPHPDDPNPENPRLPMQYRTQGIANENPDANLVDPKSIIGKPIFSLPYLGYIVDFIQKPTGIYTCAGAAIALIILMLLPDIIFPEEEPKKKKKKKGETEQTEPESPEAPTETDPISERSETEPTPEIPVEPTPEIPAEPTPDSSAEPQESEAPPITEDTDPPSNP